MLISFFLKTVPDTEKEIQEQEKKDMKDFPVNLYAKNYDIFRIKSF